MWLSGASDMRAERSPTSASRIILNRPYKPSPITDFGHSVIKAGLGLSQNARSVGRAVMYSTNCFSKIICTPNAQRARRGHGITMTHKYVFIVLIHLKPSKNETSNCRFVNNYETDIVLAYFVHCNFARSMTEQCESNILTRTHIVLARFVHCNFARSVTGQYA
jgi:hypothetical protein